MVDFGQVGTASLWKSGPLFSTEDQGGGAHARRASVESAVVRSANLGSLLGRGRGGRQQQSPAGVVHRFCRAARAPLHRSRWADPQRVPQPGQEGGGGVNQDQIWS